MDKLATMQAPGSNLDQARWGGGGLFTKQQRRGQTEGFLRKKTNQKEKKKERKFIYLLHAIQCIMIILLHNDIMT
jgi:hypothetical protein